MKAILNFVLVFLLLVLSSSTALNAQTACPQGKTAFIWVNGIMVPDASTWVKNVQALGTKFLTSQNLDSNCIKFVALYNKSDGGFRDLLQSTYQLSIPAGTYYADWNKLNANTADHTKFVATALKYMWVAPNLQSLDSDMVAIDTEIKNQWKLGYRVVLVGHSQGNWFVNKAYEIRLMDIVGTAALGKQLPNANQLSVVSIATPANYIADGRKKWTSHCNDIINVVPKSLGGDVESMIPCIASRVLSGDSLQIAGTLVVALFHFNEHSLDYYLTNGSATQEHVYQHMVDSLPDPACLGDSNCYLKDVYTSTTNYQNNWVRTKLSGYLTTGVQYSSQGYQTLYTVSLANPAISGQLTLRSRRVFTGPFTTSLLLNHIGGGKSTVSLKKVDNDSVAISLTLDNSPGRNIVTAYPTALLSGNATSFGGWRNLTITRTSSKITLSFDGKIWTTNTSDTTSGYYLELDSQGDNTMEITSLVVERPVTVTAPPPPPEPTPTPAPTTSITTILNSANSLTLWLPSTPGYYNGGMVNDECRIGGWGDEYRCLVKVNPLVTSKPASKVVIRFYKYPEGGTRSQIYLDHVTTDWNSLTKWVSQPGFILIKTLPQPVDGQWYEIDITDLYNGWVNGTYPNFGLQMRPVSTTNDVHNTFRSPLFADANYRPQLVVTSTTTTTQPPVNTRPTISLIGANPFSLTAGTLFIEPGFTATDAEDGNITTKVTVSGSVNSAVAGTYILTYNVSDSAGLSAVSQTRTINVTAPTSVGATTYTLTSATCSVVWITNYYYNYGQHGPDMKVGGWGDLYYTLFKCDLASKPKNATKVVLRIFSYPSPSGGSRVQMYLDRVTSNWDNSTKWQTKPSVTRIITLSTPVENQWYEIDITDLYNGWQNGTYPNQGIMLEPVSNGNVFNFFRSTEYTVDAFRPQLVVTSTATTPPVVPPTPAPKAFVAACSTNGALVPVTIQVHDTAYFGAASTGGTGAIHYLWTGSTGGDSSSTSQVYNSSGTFNVSVQLSDSSVPPRQVTATCPQVIVTNSAPPTPAPTPVPTTPQPLSASCSFNPNSVVLGSITNISVAASGGYPPYTYQFPGDSGYGVNSYKTVIVNSIGTFNYVAYARDSNGNTAITPSCQVTVSSATLSVTDARATPNPVKVRANLLVQLWGTNFIAGTTQVSILGPGCSLFSSCLTPVRVVSNTYLESNFTIANTGSYTVWLRNGSDSWTLAPALTINVIN